MKAAHTMSHLVMALALALAGAGCQSSKPRLPELTWSSPERIREATALAQQAQAAQRAAQRADSEEEREQHRQRAMELYRQSIAKSGDLWFAWHNLGLLHMERGENQAAAQMFNIAADVAPTQPAPLENLGILYHRLGHERPALDYFEQALDREPNYLPALRGAVVSAKRLGLTDQASLERARRGLLLETDERWREVFQAEVIRLETYADARGRP